MPPVGHIAFPEQNGDCHIKSGHIDGDDAFVIKIATGFYDNPSVGLPSSNGIMVVFSAKTGALIATLRDEGWLTDMRTGIGGALATQTLARENAQNVLIVGTGIQSIFQAECLSKLSAERSLNFNIWGRSTDKAATVVGTLQDKNINVAKVDDLKQAVQDADVIITTTPSQKPLIEREWVQAGTHITAIGADGVGKQELSTGLVTSADILVCDLKSQCLEHGEFQHAYATKEIDASNVLELGQVLSNAHQGRQNEAQITIADLTGIAAQDIAISLAILGGSNDV